MQVGRDIAKLVSQLREKGVTLWVDQDHVRFRAPRFALNRDELEELRGAKNEIANFLRREDEEGGRYCLVTEASKSARAPLTYSQRQHWNLYQLAERPAVRHLVAVKQLSGLLDVGALERAVAEVVARHSALRTRFGMKDREPYQEVSAQAHCELIVENLTSLSAEHQSGAIRTIIEQVIFGPVDVSRGPLCAITLVKIAEREHLLIIGMEHIISDMWSLGILLRELRTAYEQIANKRPIVLPDVAVQFVDFATVQRFEERSWIEQHAGYWADRLAGCTRMRFPSGPERSTGEVGWGAVPVHIEARLAGELRAWSRQQRVTLTMTVFAAYAALVWRWCERSDGIIRFESHGRLDPRLRNTIGYFTAPLYLRLALREEHTLGDWLRLAVEEYYRALEHADASYLEAQEPRPEFTGSPSFNWIPPIGDSDAPPLDSGGAQLRWQDYRFENPYLDRLVRDAEPFILFGEDALLTLGSHDPLCNAINANAGARGMHGVPSRESQPIVGAVYYPRDRFVQAAIAAFARNLTRFIEALVRGSGKRVADVLLVREINP